MIASELDGRELRQEKASTPLYEQCDGRDDSHAANNALEFIARGRVWGIDGGAYERIFGGK